LQTISLELTVLTIRRKFLLLDSTSIPLSLVYGVTYGMGPGGEGPIAAVLAESSSPDAGNVARLEMHSQRISMLPAYSVGSVVCSG
jgi:hypothetical protein